MSKEASIIPVERSIYLIPLEPKMSPIGFHVKEDPGVYRVRKIA